MKKVTLQIDTEDFAFAQRLAKSDGYTGPEDCLNGILSMAILKWRDHTGDQSPERAEINRLSKLTDYQDAKIQVLKELLSDALRASAILEKDYREIAFGEPRDAPQKAANSDLDDDIPF